MTSIAASQSMGGGQITFRTGAEWTLRELSLFATHVEVIYGVFLTLYLYPRLRGTPDDPRSALATGSGSRLVALLTEGWTGTTASNVWAYDPDLTSLRYDDSFIDPWPFIKDYDFERGEMLRLLHASLYRAVPESTLRLSSLSMSSPGSISLAGLGEPLREIRELIKDLWYRNKQEKRRGEIDIEILQHHLDDIKGSAELRRQGSIDRAVILVGNSSQLIDLLQQQGKLQPPTQSA